MLYFISPWLFCNYQFVLLNSFTFFTHPPHMATIKTFFISMILFLFSLTFWLWCVFGVGLFGFIFRTLCSSWPSMSISLTSLGKFSFLFFSNRFPISCSFSSPSETPMMWMLVHLKLSQRLLTLFSSFLFFFSFWCSDWVFFASLCSKSLIWISALSTLLLVLCKLFFISISVPSILTGSLLCCWGSH